MTQRYDEAGQVIPVTVVKAGPCTVTQVKTDAKDKYQAVQLGFGKKKNITKPVKGHIKNQNFRYLREFRINDGTGLKTGDKLTSGIFSIGDILLVKGMSKGKGYQGVVRRHHFGGSPASHGHKDQLRMSGSIGATAPQRVVKGRRMAGRMGDEQVTVKNLKIIELDNDNGLIYIKGAVPGARHGLVIITAPGELKIEEMPKTEVKEEAKKEEPKIEAKK